MIAMNFIEALRKRADEMEGLIENAIDADFGPLDLAQLIARRAGVVEALKITTDVARQVQLATIPESVTVEDFLDGDKASRHSIMQEARDTIMVQADTRPRMFES